MAGFREDRVNEEVRREVDRIIRDEVNDPRVKGTYAITRAEVTRDLRYAKIYVSVLEDEFAQGLFAALERASGFIRSVLRKRLSVRYTPELHFMRDENIAYGVHISKILKDVLPENEREDD